MTTSIFDIHASQKEAVLILCELATLSINYLYTNTHDICIISNLDIFEKYLKKELSLKIAKKISIVTILSDPELFIQTMVFLNSFDSVESRQRVKNKFTEEYAYYLKEMQNGYEIGHNELDELELTFSLGQCDQPLPFELTVMLDSKDLNDDPLSPKSVFLQQVLRFISLKHGCAFICASNTQTLMTDEKTILQFLLQIGYRDLSGTPQMQFKRPEPIVIYHTEHNFNNGSLQIHLLIPKGWDSWNKIQILATSTIYEKDISDFCILTNENEFNKLNLAYDAYFDCINSQAEQATVENCKIALYSLVFKSSEDSKRKPRKSIKQIMSLENLLEKIQTES